jgi:hypothetical protein
MGAAKRKNAFNGRTAVDSMNRIERLAERGIMATEAPPDQCAMSVIQIWDALRERLHRGVY